MKPVRNTIIPNFIFRSNGMFGVPEILHYEAKLCPLFEEAICGDCLYSYQDIVPVCPSSKITQAWTIFWKEALQGKRL